MDEFFEEPYAVNIDFRVLKYLPVGKTARLDLVAEAFNPLNRASVVRIKQGDFLEPTSLT